MRDPRSYLSRRQWGWILGAAGVTCSALAWNWSPSSYADVFDWSGPRPIGEWYSHEASEFPFDRLGDVPQDHVEPRSLADTRVRQFDELDRPRFRERHPHRGAVLNSERFTVVASWPTTSPARIAIPTSRLARFWW
jgi:hypothetical protein